MSAGEIDAYLETVAEPEPRISYGMPRVPSGREGGLAEDVVRRLVEAELDLIVL
jgi:hypothetical protein